MSQMTSGSAYGPWHRPAKKQISANSVTATSRGGVLPLLVGPFLAMAIAGAAAHETIDLDKANELVAAADSAADRGDPTRGVEDLPFFGMSLEIGSIVGDGVKP